MCFRSSKVANTKRHVANDFAKRALFLLAVYDGTFVSSVKTSSSAGFPSTSCPGTLQQLALNAVQNPDETVRQFLTPWHSVRHELEEKEFTDNRKTWQKEHAIHFRYVMHECTDMFIVIFSFLLYFHSHVALFVRLGMSVHRLLTVLFGLPL